MSVTQKKIQRALHNAAQDAAPRVAVSKNFQNQHSSSTPDVAKSSQTFQNLPESSVFPHNETCKTNPTNRAAANDQPETETAAPCSLGAMTPRQLAASRLLVQGLRVGQVAGQLGVTRQTVACWKRSAAFQAELRRLHELLATQPPPTHPPAEAPLAPQFLVDLNDEDADAEALVEQILAGRVR